HAMDAWRSSPYRGVGVYISGASRACKVQRNLNAAWVRTQLAHGWKLLPIHVGRQAACNHHANLRGHRISANPAHHYGIARTQGRAEANTAVRAAKRLGLPRRSTIFYDLEAFSTSSSACRNSSLQFLAAWTRQLKAHGYVSGVYSSATSGIRLLDRARANGSRLTLPHQIWVADWNGRANTRSSYLRSDSWMNSRVKQYRGGHTERHGGVAINIDSNFVDLRISTHTSNAKPNRTKPSHTTPNRTTPSHTTKPAHTKPSHTTKPAHTKPIQTAKPKPFKTVYLPGRGTPEAANPVVDGRCQTGRINLATYPSTGKGTRAWMHPLLQCLLKQNGLYNSYVDGYWDKRTAYGVHKLQARAGHDVKTKINHADWVSLLIAGNHRSRLVRGVRGADVVRVQRALHAAGLTQLHINGRYDHATAKAVRAYQRRVGVPATGIVGRTTWRYLEHGHV
ncbi:MAG: glycoside hydrolase domain-containing protein, partial [Marmoricola sp.]